MGMYKYLAKTYDSKEHQELMRERVISWAKQDAFTKIDYPTKIDRARALGYKAKQGFVLVRARINKGSSKREKPLSGRKPAHAGLTKYTIKMNHQHIAEMRVGKKFPNLEVLNSYHVGETGKYKWFEVILVDPSHPCIKSDKQVRWICESRGRVFRGLTSAGKKSREI